MFERTLQAGAIGTLRLANRIVMGSMHLGIESDGAALAAFYAERAHGGAGLIVTGGSCVNRAGAGGRNYSFINEPESSAPLRAAVEAVHAAGGRIALQLFHAGRYAYLASFGIQPVAPSAIASRSHPIRRAHCATTRFSKRSVISRRARPARAISDSMRWK